MTNTEFQLLPSRLVASIQRICGDDVRFHEDAAALPRGPGAYILLLRLDAPLPLAISSLEAVTLAPGWYLYAGSAHGPGGIRARAGRHLRRDKPRRWHVDHLSAAAARSFAVPIENGDECALTRQFGEEKGFAFPVKGFGSSDCRSCFSHLAKWSDQHEDNAGNSDQRSAGPQGPRASRQHNGKTSRQ